MLNSIISLNSTEERKNNKNYKYSKQIMKSLSIIIFFILFLFIKKNVDEKKINNNKSPLFPLEFKCSKNENLKSLFFEIKTESYINLTDYNTSYSKNLISSIFGQNFSFYGIHNCAREKTLVKLGFSKKREMGVYNLYTIPIGYNNWKKNIPKYIVSDYQKINRYLNYEEYTTKSGLYSNYKEMKNKFPFDYNYMAETDLYPEDKEEIILKFQNYTIENNLDNLWLLKPKGGAFGRGISILKNFGDINEKYVISKFYNNPHLIRGSKYDIRFHGLITGVKPMKLYLYKEGFARISSVKYNFSNFNDKFSFITNVAFQKKSNKYKYPKTEEEIKDSNL